MIVPSVSVGVLFCEDIREEASGALTLVGVMPDNVALPTTPVMLSKFAAFARISISLHDHQSEHDLVLRVADPSGQDVMTHRIDSSLVQQTIADSRNQGSNIATFFTRLLAVPFPIQAYGRFEAFLDVGGESYFSGSINFVPES